MTYKNNLSVKVVPSPLPTRNSFEPNEKTVIVMVGLPARGKTYISSRLTRYLNWIGISTKVFNVGNYRRKAGKAYKSHEFFSETNEEAVKIRTQAAEEALDDMIHWLNNEGEFAVFDATNTTRERRSTIVKKCSAHNLAIIFVESICDDCHTIRNSILEVKVNSPDYISMSEEQAVEDFLNRIQHYEKRYERIDDKYEDLSYIKIIDRGRKYIVNNIYGNLNCRIVYYLMNLRVGKRTIYITRHGESELNLEGRIGGDSKLSSRGLAYAESLGKYFDEEGVDNLKVWTSHMMRTIQTAQHVSCARKECWKALNELDAGHCELLTYKEIEERYPEDFANRDMDKYHYRYPMGESYEDLVARLEPFIMELGNQKNVLIVCHQAVARCLLAYFLDKTHEELPYLKIPLHQVFKLTPTAYQCIVECIDLKVPAVCTHRDKPNSPESIEIKADQ